MIPPADRIQLVRRSLNIFLCGLGGFIPIIGFIPALVAIVRAVRLHARFQNEWNPAAAYVTAGVTLALFSLGISALGGAIAVLNLIPPFGTGY